METVAARPPLAWSILSAMAAASLALHVVSTAWFGYGYSADELYFLDCAVRLDWGYVDHPPLSIALLALWRGLVGDSLLSLRLLAALIGAAAMFAAGLMAREMGGHRAAQAFAALPVLTAPAALFTTSYYSMNAIELCLWPLAVYLLLRIANGAHPATWLVLGAVSGLGLLNKHSTLWLAAGLAVGVLLTPLRRTLRSPWPWAGALVALAVAAPHLVWQWRHDWPTLEFMRNGMREVMVEKPPLEFLRDQGRSVHPLAVPLVLAGLAFALVSASMRRYRIVAWVFLVVLTILLASGNARPYYLAPAYTLAFAAGGLALEALARRRRWRFAPPVVFALLLLAALVPLPLIVPLLPPGEVAAYEAALGMPRPRSEFEGGALPPQLALQFGWPEVVDAVARAHAALPVHQRHRVLILADGFPESAAINQLGPARGLPPAGGTHNSYWMWGPPRPEAELLLLLTGDESRWQSRCIRIEALDQVDCRFCLPETRKRILLCHLRRPVRELWPELKNYR